MNSALLPLLLCLAVPGSAETPRPRAREAGVVIGVLKPGPLNAITDVPGVKVGHATLIRGEGVRTGVTAILPHGGNLFREKVPGAVVVGNGFGKLAGSTQVNELGNIETPIVLTNTLSVPRAADAVVQHMLSLQGNEDVTSVNPLVAETNDSYLNDIRGLHVQKEDVFAAIKGASGGPVEEGAVGAGVGTSAFGFKGGIGTASRVLPKAQGGYTVGVLVQTNFQGILSVNGAPVGRELGTYYFKDELDAAAKKGNSIIIVVATDAPLDARNLKRLANRALFGLARTGSVMTNGSGDYVIAFSAAEKLRVRETDDLTLPPAALMQNWTTSPVFLAAIEATEEAIVNSLFKAVTMTGYKGEKIEALPLDKTLAILRKHDALGRR